ncbi:hypothetical protein [uncultured Sphingomonas sp.]|uniref:hypothetical protein n=1 Tax=uncultured Sphingomonas sp. TaxID=158754 RepID=UPI00258D7B1E|nr:hypothetical protein [uncultured Sphingomonas sp.]
MARRHRFAAALAASLCLTAPVAAQETANSQSLLAVATAAKAGQPIGPVLSRLYGVGVTGWACSSSQVLGAMCHRVVETRCPSYFAERARSWIKGQMAALSDAGTRDPRLAGRVEWKEDADYSVSARYVTGDLVLSATSQCGPARGGEWWTMYTHVYSLGTPLTVGTFVQPGCAEIARRVARAREQVSEARDRQQRAKNSGDMAVALAGLAGTSLPPSALLSLSREAGTEMATTGMTLEAARRRRDIALWRSDASEC